MTLYTSRQIAEMYGVTKETVMKWKEQGAPLKGQKRMSQGRYPTYLFEVKELQKWLDKKYRKTPIRKVEGVDSECM